MQKGLIVLSLLVLLTGCGAYQDIQQECDTQICDMLLGRETDTSELEGALNVERERIANLEQQIQVLQLQMASITFPNVLFEEIVDPCGDDPNSVDEVLLRTSNYEYVAYFQHGNNRMLTVLEPNTNYQTTDAQKCNFVITSSGALEY